jgi:hypothetical protein
MAYEFIAIHKKTRERAIVQVKSGHTNLATDIWGNFQEKVFLFQAHGHYTGVPTENAIQIAPKAIERFMTSQSEIMPNAIRRWIDLVSKNEFAGRWSANIEVSIIIYMPCVLAEFLTLDATNLANG